MKYYWSATVVLRPHADVRIRGKALDWFKSYLSGRSQRIAVQGTMPHQFDLDCGVPQGSCLGPYYLFIFMRRICLKLLKNIFQLYALFRRGHTTLPFKPDDTNRQIDAISATNKCNQLRLILPVLLDYYCWWIWHWSKFVLEISACGLIVSWVSQHMLLNFAIQLVS